MALDSAANGYSSAVMNLLLLIALISAGSPTRLPTISEETKAIVRELQQSSSPEKMQKLEELSVTDDSARLLLGEIYFVGLFGTSIDENKACDYFEPLASKYGEAAHNLATCHYKASGRRTDQTEARRYYKLATDLGWEDSSCALGNMMIEGKGGEKDVAGGLELCLAGSEQGHAHAQADYGTYLLLGKVMPKDAVSARQWLEKAALQDHANAAFLLGQIYWKGDGITKDNASAAKWWEIAFKRGRRDAAQLLANEAMTRMMVTEGDTVKVFKDVVAEAISWQEIAEKQDGPAKQRAEAREKLDALYALRDKVDKQQ